MSDAEAPQFAIERAKELCEFRRYSEAVAMLKETVAADRQNAYAWALLSHALREAGDADGALGCARTAIKLAPYWEWPHRLASAALRAMVSHGPAVAYARECVRLAPDDWPGYVELALALGAIDACQDEAETAAQKATEIAPHESMTHLAAGLVASGAGRRDAAQEAFHRALSIDPQNAIAHHELARLEVGLGGPAPARRPAATARRGSAFSSRLGRRGRR